MTSERTEAAAGAIQKAAAPSNPGVGLARVGPRGVTFESYAQLAQFAKDLVDSRLAPSGIDTPQKALVCIQYGMELGFSPMQAMQSIYIVNGRPALYGDGLLALLRNDPAWDEDKFREWFTGEPGKDNWTANCQMGRRDRKEPLLVEYSVYDAKAAGRLPQGPDSKSPWKTAPRRMLMWRARHFAARDLFAGALRGMKTDFEIREVDELEVRDAWDDEGPQQEVVAKNQTSDHGRPSYLPERPDTTPPPIDAEVVHTEPAKKRGRPPAKKEEPKPAGVSGAAAAVAEAPKAGEVVVPPGWGKGAWIVELRRKAKACSHKTIADEYLRQADILEGVTPEPAEESAITPPAEATTPDEIEGAAFPVEDAPPSSEFPIEAEVDEAQQRKDLIKSLMSTWDQTPDRRFGGKPITPDFGRVCQEVGLKRWGEQDLEKLPIESLRKLDGFGPAANATKLENKSLFK